MQGIAGDGPVQGFKDDWGLEHLPYGERPMHINSSRVGVGKMEPGPFQWCLVTGQWAQTGTQEGPSEYGRQILYGEGGRALAQAAQRGGTVSFSEGI